MNRSTWMMAIGFGGLVVVAGPACGGGGGGGAGGNGVGGAANITPDQGCEQLATVECDAEEKCTKRDFITAYGVDKAACVSRNKTRCLASLNLAGVTVAPSALAACAEAKAKLACPGYFDPAAATACDFRGTKDNGTSCALPMECKTGVCLSVGASGCGICVDQPQLGAPCDSDQGCGRLPCAASGSCIPKWALLGESCLSAGCNPAYTCDGTGTEECFEPVGLGESCALSFPECDAKKALECSPAKKCEEIKLAPTAGVSCAGVVCQGLYCEHNAYQCHAWAPDDSSCDTVLCQPPATCQGGTCRLAPPACQ
jgi:hypothetical protein